MNSEFTIYIIKTFKLVICITVVIFFVRSFIIEPGRVNGRSMENTFVDEDIFLVNKPSLLWKTPQRGQVVQLIEPGTQKPIIKRIVGLPNEQIVIKRNHVYIKNPSGEHMLDEPYLDSAMITRATNDAPTEYPPLGPDEYFVLGDNRVVSTDSRVFGAVHRSYIQGLVMQLSSSR